MQPARVRFPGGCYIMGAAYDGQSGLADAYNFTKAIGPLETRPGHYDWYVDTLIAVNPSGTPLSECLWADGPRRAAATLHLFRSHYCAPHAPAMTATGGVIGRWTTLDSSSIFNSSR